MSEGLGKTTEVKLKKADVQKLNHGVYRLYWKEGGSSLAVVGSMHSGARWFACANWTGKDGCGIPGSDHRKFWNKVKKAEAIEIA